MSGSEYAQKGKMVWVLTVICPDGTVDVSAYSSWESIVEGVETYWRGARPYMIDGHDFGEDERRKLAENKCLKILEDRYVLEMCRID